MAIMIVAVVSSDDITRDTGSQHHRYALTLTITSRYKQYDKKPTIVAVTRPLRTSIGPSLNTT